ncbi:acyltransferase family protein [Moritella dasanensis]|uniref:acyltransferase family protein n=1 Tax=Moritella dasanensis TaxID=428031 RepID=UPI0002E41467|nr:acyltransferase family protein [Moritella dasanensis]
MSSGSLDSDLRWIPNAGVFLAYGFVYWCGWLLYGQQARLQDIKQHSYRYLLLAFILLPIASYFIQQVANNTHLSQITAHLLAVLFSGLLMWAFMLGITGWFLRCFNQYNMTARYLTDSAYWVYLIHLPVAIWITAQLAHLDWSVWTKFSITLTVTLTLSLLSYHYLVRRTVIGYWLNGKRA